MKIMMTTTEKGFACVSIHIRFYGLSGGGGEGGERERDQTVILEP